MLTTLFSIDYRLVTQIMDLYGTKLQNIASAHLGTIQPHQGNASYVTLHIARDVLIQINAHHARQGSKSKLLHPA